MTVTHYIKNDLSLAQLENWLGYKQGLGITLRSNIVFMLIKSLGAQIYLCTPQSLNMGGEGNSYS